MTDRYVLLGLAHPRTSWFRQVTAWAMSGALPIEFVKCVSAQELLVRLGSGRQHSAALLDGRASGLSRDLIEAASEAGVASIVVATTGAPQDWRSLGAQAELPSEFGHSELLTTLEQHSHRLSAADASPLQPTPERTPAGAAAATTIAVIGRQGSGVSTAAIATAQGWASDPLQGGRVLLADLARPADQALLHDADDIVPGLQELVEAHRQATPSAVEVRRMAFDVCERGYDLLLGLRRPSDWTSLTPGALTAALDNLARCYHIVVGDLDPDLEGAEGGGSVDVEERNQASRLFATRADVVLAVGSTSLVGVRYLVQLIRDLLDLGISHSRLVPVFMGSGSRPRERAELTATLAQLIGPPHHHHLVGPVHVPERRRLDDLHRSVQPLPKAVVAPLVAGCRAAVSQDLHHNDGPGLPPELLTAGSLGRSHPERGGPSNQLGRGPR